MLAAGRADGCAETSTGMMGLWGCWCHYWPAVACAKMATDRRSYVWEPFSGHLGPSWPFLGPLGPLSQPSCHPTSCLDTSIVKIPTPKSASRCPLGPSKKGRRGPKIVQDGPMMCPKRRGTQRQNCARKFLKPSWGHLALRTARRVHP